MNIFQELNDYVNHGRNVYCTIGMFDGVHLGHQHVIQHTITQARRNQGIALAITFDQHPAKVVAPERAPKMIYPLSQRRHLLASTELDDAWIIPFDKAFSQITGLTFLETICRQFQPLKSICVGPDFHFGHRRSGNIALLKAQAPILEFEIPEIDPVSVQDNEVSSTVIRALIRDGALIDVEQRLGRPYEICGPVVEGQKIGRSIGFPTANLDTSDLVLPPNGVYAVAVTATQGSLTGVMNIGYRPTRDTLIKTPTVEVHLFDCHDDLYGQQLKIQPLAHLRPEIKFDSLDALNAQIKLDCSNAKKIIQNGHPQFDRKTTKILN